MTDIQSAIFPWPDLSERLQRAHPQLDLNQRWAEFTVHPAFVPEQTAFVRWLNLNALIDKASSEEILAELAVEVTGLDVLGNYYDQTRTMDFKHGDILSPMPAVQSGKTNYLMLKQVGAGAMGEVHLAKDRLLRRTVAFKQLLQQVGGKAMDPVVIQRFLGEAQITSQLDHPHVVPIYGLETSAEGQIAYTMKMVHGDSLKQWLAKVKAAYAQDQVIDDFRQGARIRLFLKICDALSFAHDKGVIHRDLKPANIMLGRYGEVYVMDWGIARPFGKDQPGPGSPDDHRVEVDNMELYALEDGQIVGTPRYMSPEQAAGMNNELDQRSDLFAMGLILYEMVSLRQAIQAKNMPATLQKVVRGQLEPLVHVYGEAISPALAAIIGKATARRRKDRYLNLGELAADLQRLLADEKVLAHQESPLQTLQRAIQRHRQKVVPALLGMLLLGGGLVLGVQWLKQAQIAEAETQRLITGQLMAALADHGQQLGGRFQLMEGLLQQLTAAAEVSLTQGLPAKDPIYFSPQFVPGKAPVDFAPAPAWSQAISLDWPVFTFAGRNDSPLTTLQQMSPLRYACWRILSQSRGPAFLAMPVGQQKSALRQQAGELLNLYVGLPDGIYFAYPGKAGLPQDFDPRLQAWYKLASSGPGFHWGTPYLVNQALGKVIPGVQPIQDDQGHLLGVAGLEVSLSEIARQWLPMKAQTAVEAVYLVTPTGQLVAASPPVSSQDLFSAEPQAARLSEELKLSGSGFEFVDGQHFMAHTWLARLGWQLVIRGNTKALLKN